MIYLVEKAMYFSSDNVNSSEWLELVAVPSDLLSALGASSFDALLIRNSSICTIMEAVVKTSNIRNSSEAKSGHNLHNEMNENKIVMYQISVHPILAEFLVLASLPSEENRHGISNSYVFVDNEKSDLNQLRQKAFIECIHQDRICCESFEVSVIPNETIQETNLDEENESEIIIHASVYAHDDDGFEIDILNNIGWIEERLEGRIITEGSVVAVDMPFDISAGSASPRIVFLDVEEIIDEKTNISVDNRFFRLGPGGSYSLSLHSYQDEDDAEKNEIDFFIREDNSINPSNSTCPGYSHLLDKLLQLTRIHDRRGFPSGILLTGYAGVGKTTMVS